MTRAALALALVFSLASCSDKSGSSPQLGGGPSGNGGSGAPPADDKPRLVLDAELLGAIKKAAAEETPTYRLLRQRCEMYSKSEQSSGYLGLQWSEAVISLSLCWHATGDESHADRAIKYLNALLDDRQRIGDGQGGDKEVRRNQGYPIRAFGVGAALGYDWLRGARGMTPELRQRIGARLGAWLEWYGKDGYLNDNPYSNYFWGYMAALTLAGLGLDGEVEEAAKWKARSIDLLENTIIPGFASKLAGGAWVEGWQYGGLVAVNAALVVASFQTATGVDYSKKLTWLSEVPDGHLHQLHPPRKTAYSNGTHIVKPAVPKPTALLAVAFALAKTDPRVAAKARYIASKLIPITSSKYPWFSFLASLRGDEQIDPIAGAPLSYHQKGPGITFARSSWDQRAVWTAFQAGAKIAKDHQHNDQGHFELWRSEDALLYDGGNTNAFATINHNTLLIDDAGRTINYSPNQGVWARDSKTLGYSDDGRAVVVVGDLASAWDPKCAPRGCKQRSVKRAIRTFIYIRPNVLVIDDDVEVEKKSDRVSWVAHAKSAPSIKASRAAIEVGGSRVDVDVVLPASARLRAPKEPTTSPDHIYRRNEPLGDVWRLEVPGLGGQTEQRFRVWMSAANRGATQTAPKSIDRPGFTSLLGVGSEGKVSVQFAKSAAGGVGVTGGPNSRVVAVGLEAKATYRVSVSSAGSDCSVEISRKNGGAFVASAAGSVGFSVADCKLVK